MDSDSFSGWWVLPASDVGETEIPDSGKERVQGASSGRGQNSGWVGEDENSKQVRQKVTGRKRGHPEGLHEGHSAAHRPWILDYASVALASPSPCF